MIRHGTVVWGPSRLLNFSSSDSIPSAVDYKSDVQWANESHLTRAVIYSVHSVSNDSVSFTPLGITVSSADVDAVNYLMTYANHVNSLFGAPQKEREKAKSDWVQKWCRHRILVGLSADSQG